LNHKSSRGDEGADHLAYSIGSDGNVFSTPLRRGPARTTAVIRSAPKQNPQASWQRCSRSWGRRGLASLTSRKRHASFRSRRPMEDWADERRHGRSTRSLIANRGRKIAAWARHSSPTLYLRAKNVPWLWRIWRSISERDLAVRCHVRPKRTEGCPYRVGSAGRAQSYLILSPLNPSSPRRPKASPPWPVRFIPLGFFWRKTRSFSPQAPLPGCGVLVFSFGPVTTTPHGAIKAMGNQAPARSALIMAACGTPLSPAIMVADQSDGTILA